MRRLEMLKGARTLVDICAKVEAGETVLVVTDLRKTEIAEAIAAVALDRGAEPVISVMMPRDRAGQEPPKPVSEAMRTVDVVFIPVSHSITHTHAVKNAAECGTRLIVMTDFTEEMMVHGGLTADFKAVRPLCKGVASRFSEGKKVHLTTPGGTDLTFDITGRRGNALTCMVSPGEFSTVPTVEANCSPVEGTAQGKIVADASIPYIGIGLLQEPVIAEVKDGYITSISGGNQAEILISDLRSHGDPNVYNIAELGVGLNPKCRMCGIMLEDEGVMSTCHIGIGTSITLGGTVKAAVHYDLIQWHPTIKIDGKVVVDRDKVLP